MQSTVHLTASPMKIHNDLRVEESLLKQRDKHRSVNVAVRVRGGFDELIDVTSEEGCSISSPPAEWDCVYGLQDSRESSSLSGIENYSSDDDEPHGAQARKARNQYNIRARNQLSKRKTEIVVRDRTLVKSAQSRTFQSDLFFDHRTTNVDIFSQLVLPQLEEVGLCLENAVSNNIQRQFAKGKNEAQFIHENRKRPKLKDSGRLSSKSPNHKKSSDNTITTEGYGVVEDSVCLLAYGHTNSGKTHSVFGSFPSASSTGSPVASMKVRNASRNEHTEVGKESDSTADIDTINEFINYICAVKNNREPTTSQSSPVNPLLESDKYKKMSQYGILSLTGYYLLLQGSSSVVHEAKHQHEALTPFEVSMVEVYDDRVYDLLGVSETVNDNNNRNVGDTTKNGRNFWLEDGWKGADTTRTGTLSANRKDKYLGRGSCEIKVSSVQSDKKSSGNTPSSSVYLEGMTKIIVQTCQQWHDVLEKGRTARCTSSNHLNNHSSRSHAIITLSTKTRSEGVATIDTSGSEGVKDLDKMGVAQNTTIKAVCDKIFSVCFVDLAGSERQSLFGDGLSRESISINRSLSTLSTVIEKLSTITMKNERRERQRRASFDNASIRSQDSSGGCSTSSSLNRRAENSKSNATVPYICYRDSMLTILLQQYLSGSCSTTFLACVHPHIDYYHETISTMRYIGKLQNIITKSQTITNASVVTVEHNAQKGRVKLIKGRKLSGLSSLRSSNEDGVKFSRQTSFGGSDGTLASPCSRCSGYSLRSDPNTTGYEKGTSQELIVQQLAEMRERLQVEADNNRKRHEEQGNRIEEILAKDRASLLAEILAQVNDQRDDIVEPRVYENHEVQHSKSNRTSPYRREVYGSRNSQFSGCSNISLFSTIDEKFRNNLNQKVSVAKETSVQTESKEEHGHNSTIETAKQIYRCARNISNQNLRRLSRWGLAVASMKTTARSGDGSQEDKLDITSFLDEDVPMYVGFDDYFDPFLHPSLECLGYVTTMVCLPFREEGVADDDCNIEGGDNPRDIEDHNMKRQKLKRIKRYMIKYRENFESATQALSLLSTNALERHSEEWASLKLQKVIEEVEKFRGQLSNHRQGRDGYYDTGSSPCTSSDDDDSVHNGQEGGTTQRGHQSKTQQIGMKEKESLRKSIATSAMNLRQWQRRHYELKAAITEGGDLKKFTVDNYPCSHKFKVLDIGGADPALALMCLQQGLFPPNSKNGATTVPLEVTLHDECCPAASCGWEAISAQSIIGGEGADNYGDDVDNPALPVYVLGLFEIENTSGQVNDCGREVSIEGNKGSKPKCGNPSFSCCNLYTAAINPSEPLVPYAVLFACPKGEGVGLVDATQTSEPKFASLSSVAKAKLASQKIGIMQYIAHIGPNLITNGIDEDELMRELLFSPSRHLPGRSNHNMKTRDKIQKATCQFNLFSERKAIISTKLHEKEVEQRDKENQQVEQRIGYSASKQRQSKSPTNISRINSQQQSNQVVTLSPVKSISGNSDSLITVQTPILSNKKPHLLDMIKKIATEYDDYTGVEKASDDGNCSDHSDTMMCGSMENTISDVCNISAEDKVASSVRDRNDVVKKQYNGAIPVLVPNEENKGLVRLNPTRSPLKRDNLVRGTSSVVDTHPPFMTFNGIDTSANSRVIVQKDENIITQEGIAMMNNDTSERNVINNYVSADVECGGAPGRLMGENTVYEEVLTNAPNKSSTSPVRPYHRGGAVPANRGRGKGDASLYEKQIDNGAVRISKIHQYPPHLELPEAAFPLESHTIDNTRIMNISECPSQHNTGTPFWRAINRGRVQYYGPGSRGAQRGRGSISPTGRTVPQSRGVGKVINVRGQNGSPPGDIGVAGVEQTPTLKFVLPNDATASSLPVQSNSVNIRGNKVHNNAPGAKLGGLTADEEDQMCKACLIV